MHDLTTMRLLTSPEGSFGAQTIVYMGAFNDQQLLSTGQLSGNGLITYFLPVLLENAGITSQDRRLTLNFVNSVTS